ncbi:cytochrome P450 [Microbacterium sp. BWT-B31]|uniref:cytochrome P450 n=1 Tax=Microbacterium sp. BWT-B31 TaxID=3232072 RepID=UPI0035270E79
MSREKQTPPGRLGLPWLGESLALLRSNHGFYKDRAAKYGPVFKTRLFGIDFVVCSGHEAFHLFATDPRIVRGSSDPISVEQLFAGSLALIDGTDHHLRKAVMLRAVGYRSAIEAYLPRMQALIQTMVDSWMQRGGEAPVLPDLQMFAARLGGALYTGDQSEQGAAELYQAGADIRAGFQSLPFAIPGTPYARARKAHKRLTRIVDEAIARHQSGHYDDIVSRMLDAADESGVGAAELGGDIRHLLFASQGGYFVPFTLVTMALGQHPEIVAKAREEVERIAPAGPLTMDQIEQMEYLEQISKELRRYFAMNSATFFGRLTEPMQIGGYLIPAGWGAMGAIHITMRNADVFDDPERFDPDRFEPAAEAALAPGSYVPHGDGQATHHRCPGENIVTIAVKMYLTLLLRQATWTLPEQDLTLSNELFPLPESGLVVRFHQHAPVQTAV